MSRDQTAPQVQNLLQESNPSPGAYRGQSLGEKLSAYTQAKLRSTHHERMVLSYLGIS